MKNNDYIRAAIKQAGLFQWMIAEHYGLSESNFSRLMRHELSQEMKECILRIIDDLTTVQRNKEVE